MKIIMTYPKCNSQSKTSRGNRHWWMTQRSMHKLPWITIFFWSRVMWIANDFHEWRSHGWKSLANNITRMYYFISYTLIHVPNAQFCSKQLLIADFTIVAKDCLFWLSIVMTSLQFICDVTRTWGNIIVTSYLSIVLARANWQPWISIFHHPVFMA